MRWADRDLEGGGTHARLSHFPAVVVKLTGRGSRCAAVARETDRPSHVGRIVGAYSGPAEWDGPEARALIEHYLRQPARAAAATGTGG